MSSWVLCFSLTVVPSRILCQSGGCEEIRWLFRSERPLGSSSPGMTMRRFDLRGLREIPYPATLVSLPRDAIGHLTDLSPARSLLRWSPAMHGRIDEAPP